MNERFRALVYGTVFAVVVGTTMLMLVALAHQSLRAHRLPGDDTAPHTPHDSRHAEGRPL